MKHLLIFTNEEEFEQEKETLDRPWTAMVGDSIKIYKETEPTPTVECVDLGLPSGKKWMKYNLGATSETEYGDYYMFGSVTPNTDTPCDWSHAPFNNGSFYYAETYFNEHKSEWFNEDDNLKSDYDAVYQATNGAAHMPTKADFQELVDNTNSEWVTNYEGSGVNGRIFRSRKDMDKYIFITASGDRWGTSVSYQGYNAGLWSSSLYASSPGSAWYLYFDSGDYNVDYNLRYDGFCLRGICS